MAERAAVALVRVRPHPEPLPPEEPEFPEDPEG